MGKNPKVMSDSRYPKSLDKPENPMVKNDKRVTQSLVRHDVAYGVVANGSESEP
jgi:hypothetical protein